MGCFSAAAVSVLSSMARPLSEDVDGDALDEWHDELWELLEASLNCFQGNSAYYHMVPQRCTTCIHVLMVAQSQEFFSKSISPGFDNAGISVWQRRINQNAACPRVRSTAISQPFRICLKRESLIRSNRYSVLIFELSEQIGLKTRQADLRNNPADDGGAKPQDHSR